MSFVILIVSLLFFTLVSGNPNFKLKSAIVNGVSLSDFNQELFGGVPFAEPPIGSLRSSPPV
ncbi:hypothetical protein ACEPAF_4327 [Sanghuangporus sanghuang]